MDRYTTQLAGEFLAAGELSRRGFPVSTIMGNAKFVGIIASTSNGEIRIDAKTGGQRATGQFSTIFSPDVIHDRLVTRYRSSPML